MKGMEIAALGAAIVFLLVVVYISISPFYEWLPELSLGLSMKILGIGLLVTAFLRASKEITSLEGAVVLIFVFSALVLLALVLLGG